MPSPSYPYAVGRVRILEGALLDDAKLQRLRELPFGDAVRQLSDWGYAAEYPVRDDIDALIDFRMGEIHAVVDDVTPDKELTDLFWLPLDAANIKYLIKARMLRRTDAGDDELERGVYDLALLRDCVAARDYAALGQPLGDLLTQADAALTGDTGPRTVSAAVDRAIYDHIFTVLSKKHNDFCSRYFTAAVDFTNIVSLRRADTLNWPRDAAAAMLLPGGGIDTELLLSTRDADDERTVELLSGSEHIDVIKKAFAALPTGGVAAMDELFGQTLLGMARDARFDSFGIGPIAYYMLRGIDECRTLRVLFARKRTNL